MWRRRSSAPTGRWCPARRSPGRTHRPRTWHDRATRSIPRTPSPWPDRSDPTHMRTPDLEADVAEILITEEQIQAKVQELGVQLSRDYEGRSLTLVSVLKGSLPFMADLMRAI